MNTFSSHPYPKGSKYYTLFINPEGIHVMMNEWGDYVYDKMIRESGNFFLTEKEAEEKRDKIIQILKA